MSFPLIFFLKKHSYFKTFTKRECSTVPPTKEPIVTILNAATGVGKNLALLLKQSPHIEELRLFDNNKCICTIAEDLSHIDTKTQIKSFVGQNVLKNAITDANIVVTVGGDRKSCRDTFEKQFDRNVDDVRIAALNMIEFNPKAVFCIARPPIEGLVPLVSEEYKKAGVYDWKKIFGITSAASMRANSIIACKNNQQPNDVVCPIVGGLDNECLVAVLSQVRPKGRALTAELQKEITCSEDEILNIYGGCSGLHLLPALGISRFVNTLIKALKGDTNCVECAFVRQISHIGSFLPYMTSIVRLGRHGVLSTHMPKVDATEGYLLQKAAIRVKQYIRHGESFVTGEPQTAKETPESRETEITESYVNKPFEPNVAKAT